MDEIAIKILNNFDVFKSGQMSINEIAMVCKAFQLQIEARLPSSNIDATPRLKQNAIIRINTALKR